MGAAQLVVSDTAFDPISEQDPVTSEWIAGRGPDLVERFDMRGLTIFHFAMTP
jgi:hypothetical protein